jgi:hypothetical protein
LHPAYLQVFPDTGNMGLAYGVLKSAQTSMSSSIQNFESPGNSQIPCIPANNILVQAFEQSIGIPGKRRR